MTAMSNPARITMPNGASFVPDERGYIEGEITLFLDELLAENADSIPDRLGLKMTGSPLLARAACRPLRVELDGGIVFLVRGDPSMILDQEMGASTLP